jgi:putative protein-disulfide isomerase
VENHKVTNSYTQAQPGADRVEITYYTDPLCCWSWGFEPQWRRLQYEYAGKLTWRYCMGGLLPSWKDYNDEMNSISRPIQMGPVWMHASQLSGMPMNTKIWMEDPPVSSYPACIAVKCAEMQSPQAGERYLRLLREALMIHGKNISKQTVLFEIAEELSAENTTAFDINEFKEDLKNDKGLEAFRHDLQEVQVRHINRYPTLILRHEAQSPRIITGYRPFNILLDAVKQVAPSLIKVRDASADKNYASHWASITDREIAEAVALS